MNNDNDKPKKAALTQDLYKRDPVWFRAAIAYRLVRLLTPKRISRNLPRILRTPLLPPGVSFPVGWRLPSPFPPGLTLPPGVWFPPGWSPGDPLPPGYQIDTAVFFPPGWTVRDPLPPGLILPPGVTLAPGWGPGDPLPLGYEIDTSNYFPPGWESGDPPPDGSIPDVDLPSWVTEPFPPWPTDPNVPIPKPPGVSPEYIAYVNFTNTQVVWAADGVIGKTGSDWGDAHDAATGLMSSVLISVSRDSA